ncbi:hypothetical protein SAMN05216377_11546 [Pseudonocardia oroxyli]|uniref:Uncharacterized protein n=1 Tax=Pseudonocardia oroxyli TaxID=366584 RepID=A0A1G7X0J3_PSEOR|nr:hypothetical protein SAMN05216377_11546 [Pseudonocardia oroxyli]
MMGGGHRGEVVQHTEGGCGVWLGLDALLGIVIPVRIRAGQSRAAVVVPRVIRAQSLRMWAPVLTQRFLVRM